MRHNEKSENIARGRRLLVVASQTVGVVAVHRPHRRPNPFISGQSFHFQMTGALGDTMLIPLSLKFCRNFAENLENVEILNFLKFLNFLGNIQYSYFERIRMVRMV